MTGTWEIFCCLDDRVKARWVTLIVEREVTLVVQEGSRSLLKEKSHLLFRGDHAHL